MSPTVVCISVKIVDYTQIGSIPTSRGLPTCCSCIARGPWKNLEDVGLGQIWGFGSPNWGDQGRDLAKGCHCLVATPGAQTTKDTKRHRQMLVWFCDLQDGSCVGEMAHLRFDGNSVATVSSHPSDFVFVNRSNMLQLNFYFVKLDVSGRFWHIHVPTCTYFMLMILLGKKNWSAGWSTCRNSPDLIESLLLGRLNDFVEGKEVRLGNLDLICVNEPWLVEPVPVALVPWAWVPGNVSRLVVDEADRMLAAWQRCLWADLLRLRCGYESKPWYPDGTLSWFMDVYSPKTW